MNITIQEMAEKLKEYDEYRIVYHIRPDGDCIGSSFALALALQAIGKKCDVTGQDDIPRIHRYMTDKVKLDILENPAYIAVDSASLHRVGSYGDKHLHSALTTIITRLLTQITDMSKRTAVLAVRLFTS